MSAAVTGMLALGRADGPETGRRGASFARRLEESRARSGATAGARDLGGIGDDRCRAPAQGYAVRAANPNPGGRAAAGPAADELAACGHVLRTESLA